MRARMGALGRTDGQNHAPTIRCHFVRMSFVEIEDDAGDQRRRTVLASAHADHATPTQRTCLDVLVADGAGKIEEDTVWVSSGVHHGLYRCTQRDFNADASALPLHR